MAICTEPAQVISTFVAAYRACDVDALTALYEEDATVYDIDGTCRGLAEIRKMWQAFANQFEVLDYRIDEREEQVVGEYAFGHMTMTAALRPRGTTAEPMVVNARSTEIMRRGSDGGWRFYVDHASVPLPPPAGS